MSVACYVIDKQLGSLFGRQGSMDAASETINSVGKKT
jgi:hypothetical protein